MKMELIVEEMCVLYVVLMCVKEKLILIGIVKDVNKEMEKWFDVREYSEWLLLDYICVGVFCYLDWIVFLLYRYCDSEMFFELG